MGHSDGGRMIKVDIFHTPECEGSCGGVSLALDNVNAVLDKAGIKCTLEVHTLLSEEDAVRWKVMGSPSIHVNGKDVGKGISPTQDYGLKCRSYGEGRRLLNAPSKLMILKALNGEQANPIICYCKGVRKDAIVWALRTGVKTFKEVQTATGAATGTECDVKNPTGKCCSPFVAEIIQEWSGQPSDAGIENCCKK